MTIILENTKQIKFHSELGRIVQPFREEFKALNWLISDLEYSIFDFEQKGGIKELSFEDKAIKLPGEDLLEIIETRDIQFIWGVFSGFKGLIPKIQKGSLPYADGNPAIWNKPEEFQISDAEMEIICWDSSATLIKFKSDTLASNFLKFYTDGRILKNKR